MIMCNKYGLFNFDSSAVRRRSKSPTLVPTLVKVRVHELRELYKEIEKLSIGKLVPVK